MERTRRGEAEVEREETRRILHGSLSKKAKSPTFLGTRRKENWEGGSGARADWTSLKSEIAATDRLTF